MDNLRTNHRGVYVLQDNLFKPLLRLSLPLGPTSTEELANLSKIQLAYPVGIIRGALARLGVTSTVVAETTQIPQCKPQPHLPCFHAQSHLPFLHRHIPCKNHNTASVALHAGRMLSFVSLHRHLDKKKSSVLATFFPLRTTASAAS